MKKSYYLFNPGRLSRKDNTLKFIPVDQSGVEGKPKYLPVEGVKNLFVFGSLDANSALYNFLARQQIPVHFFDYYEHYTGSFMPKDYLHAGKMQIEQTRTYLRSNRRMHLARAFLEGGSFNMLKNLRYYQNRGRQLESNIASIEKLRKGIEGVEEPSELMGVEGNIRQIYYRAFEEIITHFEMGPRIKRPPSNEVNALISFGNMMCYTLALDQLYHTQLNPTISFLHEPGFRRYSLALDLAEVFKPVLVDRVIFRVLNKREIQASHFQREVKGCTLNETGKKTFIKVWEEKAGETIKHRTLKRKVSYKQLVKLECYKIAKYILRIDEEYKPFKVWW
ncbi:MAG: type I-B CRISPR-associated endonuclease Cas1 [Saprospirales bacterium]|nr:MAG: type I-B CRISPR-associated endonuclease Cas1 [Saprospirales bacterium]